MVASSVGLADIGGQVRRIEVMPTLAQSECLPRT